MKKTLAYTLSIVIGFATTQLKAQQTPYIELLKQEPKWVNSVFKKLNKKQKIAQMFFVAAYTNKSKAFTIQLEK